MPRDQKRILRFARALARRCAQQQPLGLCTVDDVQVLLPHYGHDPRALGSTAGVIFRTDEWVSTPLSSPSRRPSNRRRQIQVWQLARAAQITPLRVARGKRRRSELSALHDLERPEQRPSESAGVDFAATLEWRLT